MMLKDYTILAIDTSCDETSAAVTVNDRVFSNIVSSQVELHKKYGGVVPIIAQRAHKKRIDAVISEAIIRAQAQNSKLKTQNYSEKLKTINLRNIDAIAITVGPGLAPALEVGIAKAKELALKYSKPLIAVNHMEGHLLSSFAKNSRGKSTSLTNDRYKILTTYESLFPLIGLLVSGGHTQLVLMEGFGDYKLLGETLDDACGEAFDKVAKILELGYPGGPIVERLAKDGDENAYDLPVPMIERKDLNFSFSGLKTAMLYLVKDLRRDLKLQKESTITIGIDKNKHMPKFVNNQGKLKRKIIVDVCASFQKVVAEHLIGKLTLAVARYKPEGILLGGGVISNLYIRRKIRAAMRKMGLPVFLPYDKKLLTDNAVMIGVCAYYKARRGEFVKDIEKLERKPGLSF